MKLSTGKLRMAEVEATYSLYEGLDDKELARQVERP